MNSPHTPPTDPTTEAEEPHRRRPHVVIRVLGSVAVLSIAAVVTLALVAVTIILLAYPLGIVAAVIVAVLITFVAGLGAERLRRRLLRSPRGRFPLFAAVLSVAVATALIGVILVPSPSYESTGSSLPQASMKPQQVPTHTGDTVAVYRYAPKDPDPSLDPILFINGGPGNAPAPETHSFLERFTGLGYTVYLYDPIGINQSPLPKDPSSYSIEHEVRVVGDILDHYKIPRANLVAHSYGGAVAPRYITAHPERVAAYVALDTAPIYSLSQGNRPGEAPQQPPADAATPDLLDRTNLRLLAGDNLMFLWNQNHHAWGTESEYDYWFARQLIQMQAAGQPLPDQIPFRVYTLATSLINKSMDSSPDYTKKLKTVATPPLLVIHPEHGVVPWNFHYELRDYFTDVTFAAAPGVDHGMWLTPQGADLILRDTDAFLRGQPVPDAYTGESDPFAE